MNAVVIGGVNIDIGGKSLKKLVPGDSNPGRVRTSLGGVGRNIAHNLRLLGVPVSLLTAFGDDEYARRIEASCAMLGIDISHALQIPDGHTSTYLYVGGPDGDMSVAISDMEICDRITPDYLERNLSLINEASVIIIDANLPEESIAYICAHAEPPILADPVSTAKAGRLKPYLSSIYALKPNRIEAELLTGIEIRDEESLALAAGKLIEEGLQRVYISLGDGGVFAADGEQMTHIFSQRVEVRNATGAGDAFTAAMAWACLRGLGLVETGQLACKAARIAIQGEETINPDLSEDRLLSEEE